MKSNFDFEEVHVIACPNGLYHEYSFVIFREKTTDVLWIKTGNSFSEMHDPETGLPLTYKVWQDKYQK